jgi:hypothetical protein
MRTEKPCVWCREALGADAVDVPGGERMHPACADQFDTLVYGETDPTPALPPLDESDALVWDAWIVATPTAEDPAPCEVVPRAVAPAA